MKNKQVYFRVDGGNVHSVAMGHIYRCLKLATFLLKHTGLQPIFIMKDYPEGISLVKEYDIEVILLSNDIADLNDLNETIYTTNNQILFVDVRHYQPIHITALRKTTSKLVLFDDLGEVNYRPDILVNPSVLPKHRYYPNQYNDVNYCLGTEFFIMGEQSISPVHQVSNTVNAVLVSLGGADPDNYSYELIKKISPIMDKFEIMFVLGPAYEYHNQFTDFIETIKEGKKIQVLRGVNNLPDLMIKSDLAIVAGGDTCLELCWSGTPGLIAPTIYYEKETADYLDNQNIILNLGDIKKETSISICSTILSLVNNLQKRREFAENGRSLIDGQGIHRLYRLLGEL